KAALESKIESKAGQSSSEQTSTPETQAATSETGQKLERKQQRITKLDGKIKQISAVKEAVAAVVATNSVPGQHSNELMRQAYNAYARATWEVFREAKGGHKACSEETFPLKAADECSVYRFKDAPTETVIALNFLKLNLKSPRQSFSSSSPEVLSNALKHTYHVYEGIMNNWDRYGFDNIDPNGRGYEHCLHRLLDMSTATDHGDPGFMEMVRIAGALLRANQDPSIKSEVERLFAEVLDGETTLAMLLEPRNYDARDTFAGMITEVREEELTAAQINRQKIALLKLRRSMLSVQRLLLKSLQNTQALLEAQAAQDAEAPTSAADAAAQQPQASSSDSAAATSSRAERERGRDRERRAQQTGTDTASTAGSTSRGRSTTRRSASESAARSRSHSRHKERFFKVMTLGMYKRSKSADITKSKDIEISNPSGFVHTGSGSADRAVDEAQATTTPPASTSRAGRTDRRTDRTAQDSGATGSSTRSRQQPRTSTGGGQDAAASRRSSSTNTLQWRGTTGGNAPEDDVPPALPPRLPITTTQPSPTDAPVNEGSAASSTTAPQPRTRTVFRVINTAQSANGSVQTGDDEIDMEGTD
ncbi:MAG: hypothetical protein ACRC7P_06590, partial [Enterovibrio sp.]